MRWSRPMGVGLPSTMTEKIPLQVATVIGDVLGTHYYSHTRLNTLFVESGAPGVPPAGNCVDKCQAWLKRCNGEATIQPLRVLGEVLQEFMDHDQVIDANWLQGRERVERVLSRNGLEYRTGGRMLSATASVASPGLEEILRAADLPSIEDEFSRALQSATADPPAALTAACAIIEAACKTYLEQRPIPLPSKQTIKLLWSLVQDDLGLDPAKVEDDDLKRILGGLSSIVDGLGALRTHAGSAHGRGPTRYRVSPRHARLAVNTAHTLVLFLLETWTSRTKP